MSIESLNRTSAISETYAKDISEASKTPKKKSRKTR